MYITYRFERDNPLASHARVSTDAINAVISVIGDWPEWHYVELTDENDPRPRIRVTFPSGAPTNEYEAKLSAALREHNVRIVDQIETDFLRRKGLWPTFAKKQGETATPPPIVGSVVQLRIDDEEHIRVLAQEKLEGNGFRGIVHSFELKPRSEYKSFRTGEEVHFLDEHVFAIDRPPS